MTRSRARVEASRPRSAVTSRPRSLAASRSSALRTLLIGTPCPLTFAATGSSCGAPQAASAATKTRAREEAARMLVGRVGAAQRYEGRDGKAAQHHQPALG